MRIEAYELQTNGIVVDKTLLGNALVKYRGLYSDACFGLYDNCYLSSPSEFDLSEVARAFREEFPEYMHLFVSEVDATIVWTSERCGYAKCIAKKTGASKEAIKFLTLLESVLYASESISALENLEARCRFGNKTRVLDTIIPRISISTKVRDISKFKCDYRATHEAFQVGRGSVLIRVNTKKMMRDKALEMLGVSEESIKKIDSSGKAFFSKYLTQEEELRFLDMFLSGEVKADGVAAKALNKKLEEEAQYSVAQKGSMTVVQKFVERVFVDSLDERCEFVKNKRRELESKYSYVKPFYVDGDCVTFEVAKNELSCDSANKFSVPKRFVGTCILDYESEEKLPSYCMLYGHFGEYITQAEVFKNRYHAEGKPVKIQIYSKSANTVKKHDILCYNIANVYYSDKRNDEGELITRTLEPKFGIKVSVPIISVDALWGMYGAVSKYDFYRSMRRAIKSSCFDIDNTIKEGYLDLVAELVCAFKYFDNCGEAYVRVNSCYDFITEELYDMACYEANDLFYRI